MSSSHSSVSKLGRLQSIKSLPDNPKANSIVFIHGLSGSAKSTWSAMADLFASDGRFADTTIDYYQYPTSLIRLPWTPPLPRLPDLAHGLRTLIEEKHSSSSISIVAHSLGGLIARQFIVDALKSGRPLSVNRLVLVAVPNTGASLANVASLLSMPHFQLKALARDSDALNQLNIDWLNVSADDALRVKYILGGADRIVNHLSGSPYSGLDTASLLIEADHRSIVLPIDHKDIRYLAVSNFLIPTSTSTSQTLSGTPNAPTFSMGDPLFDIYTALHEPFYYSREFDTVMGEVVVGSHVWVTGRSGIGKSAALRRVVGLAGWRLLHINLATHETRTADGMIEALAEELLNLRPDAFPRPRGSEPEHRLRKLKAAIENLVEDAVVGLIIEEIPLEAVELNRFLQHMGTLAELMGSDTSRPQQVRLLFSSIQSISDTSGMITAKTRESIQVIPVTQWSTKQMLGLGQMIKAASGTSISDEALEEVVAAAEGSPRFMKAVFRKFRNGIESPDDIDKVCYRVKMESL